MFSDRWIEGSAALVANLSEPGAELGPGAQGTIAGIGCSVAVREPDSGD